MRFLIVGFLLLAPKMGRAGSEENNVILPRACFFAPRTLWLVFFPHATLGPLVKACLTAARPQDPNVPAFCLLPFCFSGQVDSYPADPRHSPNCHFSVGVCLEIESFGGRFANVPCSEQVFRLSEMAPQKHVQAGLFDNAVPNAKLQLAA